MNTDTPYGWTTAIPTEPGNYWRVCGDETMIVAVDRDDGGTLEFTYHGNECTFTADEITEGLWWSEPIAFPQPY